MASLVANKRPLEDKDGKTDIKKQQTEIPPSRVVLIRSINPAITATNLQDATKDFNDGAEVKILRRGNQAFAEFQDEAKAASFIERVKLGLVLGGAQLAATYSLRSEIIVKQVQAAEPSKICLITIGNLLYPVDLETLHGLLSKFGAVEKIVCFSKKPQVFQALVQFRAFSDAKTAMSYLHNVNMYDNCNTVQILPSKLSEVVVKENDKSKSWDFTKAPLPTLSGASLLMSMPNAALGPRSHQMDQAQQLQFQQLQQFQQYQQQAQQLQALQYCFPLAAAALPNTTTGAFQNTTRDVLSAGAQSGQSPVLVAYSIPQDKVTIQMIFNLFSLYGNVQRVKRVWEKPNTALIQFSNPTFASMARSFLHEAEMFGSRIQVMTSKFMEVKIPTRVGSGGELNTKEFTATDQRYIKPEWVEKYQKSACQPTSTIFVANVAESVTEVDFKTLFQPTATVEACSIRKPKPTATKYIALMKLGSPEQALNTICTFHNQELKGSQMKLAFSKMTSI